MLNFALLVGIVVASLNSLHPRNPVFQCWGGDIDWEEESEDGSTSEEDSDKIRSLESIDDSVSLFSSRTSRKSVRTLVKVKEDRVSVAEKGFSGYSVSSTSSDSSGYSSSFGSYGSSRYSSSFGYSFSSGSSVSSVSSSSSDHSFSGSPKEY